jgi:hypothetical protein
VRRYDHRAPSVAFIAVTVIAFIVVAACAAHALAVNRGWSDPVPGFDPFATDRSADRTDSQPAPRPARAVVPRKVVHHRVTHGVAVDPGHSQPLGHAYGHVAHQDPHGLAHGWATSSHGRALSKGHAKQAR